MKLTRKDRLFLDMVLLAKLRLEEATEDEIQEWYGSDYYNDLQKYLKNILDLRERGEL